MPDYVLTDCKITEFDSVRLLRRRSGRSSRWRESSPTSSTSRQPQAGAAGSRSCATTRTRSPRSAARSWTSTRSRLVNGKVVRRRPRDLGPGREGQRQDLALHRREEGDGAAHRRRRGRVLERPESRPATWPSTASTSTPARRWSSPSRRRRSPEVAKLLTRDPAPQAVGRRPHRRRRRDRREHEALAGARRGRGRGADDDATASRPPVSRATASARSRRWRRTPPRRDAPRTAASSSSSSSAPSGWRQSLTEPARPRAAAGPGPCSGSA